MIAMVAGRRTGSGPEGDACKDGYPLTETAITP
jgi:hypothetical protein